MLCPYTLFRFRSQCPLKTLPLDQRFCREQGWAKLETALIDSHYSAAIRWVVSLVWELDDVHRLEADIKLPIIALDSNTQQCLGWALLRYYIYISHRSIVYNIL